MIWLCWAGAGLALGCAGLKDVERVPRWWSTNHVRAGQKVSCWGPQFSPVGQPSLIVQGCELAGCALLPPSPHAGSSSKKSWETNQKHFPRLLCALAQDAQGPSGSHRWRHQGQAGHAAGVPAGGGQGTGGRLGSRPKGVDLIGYFALVAPLPLGELDPARAPGALWRQWSVRCVFAVVAQSMGCSGALRGPISASPGQPCLPGGRRLRGLARRASWLIRAVMPSRMHLAYPASQPLSMAPAQQTCSAAPPGTQVRGGSSPAPPLDKVPSSGAHVRCPSVRT